MKLVINIISDTSGNATEQIVKQTLLQFDIEAEVKIHPFIRDEETVRSLFNYLLIYGDNQIIYHSLQDSSLNLLLSNLCESHGLSHVDILSYSIETMANKLGLDARFSYNDESVYDTESFKRFNAIDFAVKNDDGKDFRAVYNADIVVIGVSRSSKTPLSMYLAGRGYRVANIPILLDVEVPGSLYEIDPDKIFGLYMDPERLSSYRKERLKSLDLDSESAYSDIDRIREELEYADEIMEDLGCTVIDVSHRSIEETADVIIQSLK